MNPQGKRGFDPEEAARKRSQNVQKDRNSKFSDGDAP